MYKSSDIRLKDFYYDEGRSVIVSTKCPNEKDIKWRNLPHAKSPMAALCKNNKVIRTVRKDQVRDVFDVLLTASQRQDMPYRSSPVNWTLNRSAQPEPCVTPATEKKPGYSVCVVITGGLSPINKFEALKEAQDFAEARAKVNSGTKFAVIQILGTVVAGGVTWE
jgi:hypothetical protein